MSKQCPKGCCVLESLPQCSSICLRRFDKIDYIRVEGMDHYIRKRPDIIDQSFEWLKNQLDQQRTIGAQHAAIFRAG
jgi:hypothetical protein